VQALIATAFGLLIVVALQAARGLGKRLCGRDTSVAGWGTILGRALARTNNFFIVAVAARLVTRFGGAPGEVQDAVGFLFTIAAVVQAAIWAREIILGAVERRTEGDGAGASGSEALTSALGLIRLLVTFALFAIALIVVLDNLGVNVTGLVAGLGVGGIAIGLAAQGIFADLFAALAIIFDRPFRRGDAVSYDQTNGTVEEIGLKSTRIRGVDGEQRIIANKTLLDKEIRNNTQRDRHHTKWALGIAYETSADTLDRIPAMLREVVEAAGAHFTRAGFVGFGPSSLTFEIEFDSPSPDFQHHYDLRHAIGLTILRRFREADIVMPFPIQTTYTAAPDGTLVMPYAGPSPNASVLAPSPRT
jgi:small-conductance mechanosensitive channel